MYALLICPCFPPFSFCLFLPDFLHSPWGSVIYELCKGVDGVFQPVTFVLCARNGCRGVLYCTCFIAFTDQRYLCQCPEALVQQGIKEYADLWIIPLGIIPPKSCGYRKDMLTSVRLCTWVPRYHDAKYLCSIQTGQCPGAQGLAKPQAALRHWFSYCTSVLSALHEFVFISHYLSVLKISRLNSENSMQI